MMLMLYQKDLVNGAWTRVTSFKPQFIKQERLEKIRKREESKYPGHIVCFRYVEVPEELVKNFDMDKFNADNRREYIKTR